jgi:hypothetical protein
MMDSNSAAHFGVNSAEVRRKIRRNTDFIDRFKGEVGGVARLFGGSRFWAGFSAATNHATNSVAGHALIGKHSQR